MPKLSEETNTEPVKKSGGLFKKLRESSDMKPNPKAELPSEPVEKPSPEPDIDKKDVDTPVEGAKRKRRTKEELEASKIGGALSNTTENRYVYVERGFTKNMDNFNSARCNIGVNLPINPTDEDIEEAKKTIKIALEIVEDALTKQLEELS